jgi:predicted NUDIX family phosphoesterase
MRIREIIWMGLKVWPPQWSDPSQEINNETVLQDVKFIVGTDLFRIDVDHDGKAHPGIIFVEKDVRATLYHKLKENIGRKWVEIEDLEIEID